MVTTTTPLSSVLHQLLASTNKPSSSKGKGKGRSPSSNFLSATTSTSVNDKDWSETVKAFCDLVVKYKGSAETEGIFCAFSLGLWRAMLIEIWE